MTQTRWKTVRRSVGLGLLIALALTQRVAELLYAELGEWVSVLNGVLLATALLLLGVVQPERGPAEYLVPALGVVAFYGLVAVQSAELWAHCRPTDLGWLVMILALMLGAWSALRGKSWRKFDARAAAALFAALLVAGLSSLRMVQMGGYAQPMRMVFAFEILTWYHTLLGVCLLPLLSKDRWGGLALLGVGGVCVALYLLFEASGLGLYLTNEGRGSFLYVVYGMVFRPMLVGRWELYVGLALGGLWCAWPRKAGAGVDKRDLRA